MRYTPWIRLHVFVCSSRVRILYNSTTGTSVPTRMTSRPFHAVCRRHNLKTDHCQELQKCSGNALSQEAVIDSSGVNFHDQKANNSHASP